MVEIQVSLVETRAWSCTASVGSIGMRLWSVPCLTGGGGGEGPADEIYVKGSFLQGTGTFKVCTAIAIIVAFDVEMKN